MPTRALGKWEGAVVVRLYLTSPVFGGGGGGVGGGGKIVDLKAFTYLLFAFFS